MKTHAAIDEEILKLKKMKPTVRHFDAFGSDHWLVIDAQVVALERRYDHDEAYVEFPTESEDEDPIELNGALDAIDWMRDEDGSEVPSSEWLSLVIK